MASIRERKNGTFEMKFTHTLLERPHWTTHDTREAAEEYDQRLRKTLDSGVVPPELVSLLATATPVARRAPPAPRMSQVLREYLNEAPIAASDRPMVESLQATLTMRADEMTVLWCDDWVKRMKRVDYLAPGTIRKKVESLARAYDWWLRKTGAPPVNPLRLFPKGYSTYKEDDVPEGKDPRVDERRNRRLDPLEPPRIESVILGAKRAGRERGIGIDDRPAFLLLWRLIVNTGMRLREAYSLGVKDIRFDLRTIHIPRSKMTRGRVLAARDIPMTKEVFGWLKAHTMPPSQSDLVFPFWSGDDEELERTTNKLSQLFSRVFDHAEVEDLTEHDLRHEAVCRWMLLKDGDGRWVFRPEEVRRITGHTNVQQFERYLSLRGSDLAERLW